MEPPSISFAGQALSSGGMEKRVKNQVKVQAKIKVKKTLNDKIRSREGLGMG
jgi:hypothetical protein